MSTCGPGCTCSFCEAPIQHNPACKCSRCVVRGPGIVEAANQAMIVRNYENQIATLKAEVERLTKEQYQSRVREWLLACFGEEIASDVVERNFRFLEESLELVQSLGCSKDEAMSLVNYVYERPVGEPSQEAGGVMVTLACLCGSNGLDMNSCGETELARIWTKVEAIRAKQAAKPRMITGDHLKARGEV